MPPTRQAIIWTNDGLLYWRIFASLGLKELTVVSKEVRYSDSDWDVILIVVYYDNFTSNFHCNNHYNWIVIEIMKCISVAWSYSHKWQPFFHFEYTLWPILMEIHESKPAAPVRVLDSLCETIFYAKVFKPTEFKCSSVERAALNYGRLLVHVIHLIFCPNTSLCRTVSWYLQLCFVIKDVSHRAQLLGKVVPVFTEKHHRSSLDTIWRPLVGFVYWGNSRRVGHRRDKVDFPLQHMKFSWENSCPSKVYIFSQYLFTGIFDKPQ